MNKHQHLSLSLHDDQRSSPTPPPTAFASWRELSAAPSVAMRIAASTMCSYILKNDTPTTLHSCHHPTHPGRFRASLRPAMRHPKAPVHRAQARCQRICGRGAPALAVESMSYCQKSTSTSISMRRRHWLSKKRSCLQHFLPEEVRLDGMPKGRPLESLESYCRRRLEDSRSEVIPGIRAQGRRPRPFSASSQAPRLILAPLFEEYMSPKTLVALARRNWAHMPSRSACRKAYVIT